MNINDIKSLWESNASIDRIQALNELSNFNFVIGEAMPELARVILAHAMYHDYRKYPETFEIWAQSLLIASNLCEKYNWTFKNIALSDSESESL